MDVLLIASCDTCDISEGLVLDGDVLAAVAVAEDGSRCDACPEGPPSHHHCGHVQAVRSMLAAQAAGLLAHRADSGDGGAR